MKKMYYNIFLLSEGLIGFFSGIFISVATNILTSGIPNNKPSDLGWHIILSVIMWFIAGLSAILWTITVKPVQEAFEKDSYLGKQAVGGSNWYKFITDEKRKKARIRLNFCVVSVIASITIGIVLWCLA